MKPRSAASPSSKVSNTARPSLKSPAHRASGVMTIRPVGSM
jgi:hypothetical protein